MKLSAESKWDVGNTVYMVAERPLDDGIVLTKMYVRSVRMKATISPSKDGEPPVSSHIFYDMCDDASREKELSEEYLIASGASISPIEALVLFQSQVAKKYNDRVLEFRRRLEELAEDFAQANSVIEEKRKEIESGGKI